MTKLIDRIALPEGLRSLSLAELEQVALEVRNELIDSVAESGGHFAASLGVTELSVALHHCFDTPLDRLVWDVGHQGYVHKMLTGRRSRLKSIRQKGGISGFLKRSESSYDAFGAGHAGTSISAAVGMAAALRNTNPERSVVAVIGDGAMTCGMAFEALNHAGDLGLGNLIVVLNDNKMSIAPNVGALSWLFSRAVTSRSSTRARSKFKALYKRGFIPAFLYKLIDRAEEMTQSMIAGPAMLFESFGFRYIGPIDGHNLADVVTALNNAKQQDIPTLVHVHTTKGKGYDPAEADPVKWHATNPFDREQGSPKTAGQKKSAAPPAYTDIFAATLRRLAKADPSLVAITAAMPSGTGLDKFAEEYAERCFDVGICEQHAVTFAAGLACEGLKPVCAIYSTFLQRAYDQVVHDVCIQKLPVVFAMDRGGVVGNDGETHQGVFDIAYLRTVPNMVLMSPKDENELQHMLYSAIEYQMPVGLRYPRGTGTGKALDANFERLPFGRAELVQSGDTVLFVSFGPVLQYAEQAAQKLSEVHGIEATVINARFAKPLDVELLSREIPRHSIVCTIEDHALAGGFGSAVLETINAHGIEVAGAFLRFGVGDRFIDHASQADQHAQEGYDARHIFEQVAASLPERRKVVSW